MMTQHTEQAQNTSSTASRRETIVLIDGHAMIHRAFHAVPENLTTKSGEPINATFGFTNILIKALGDVKPDYIAVTFDRAAPTFRHEQFVAYKAHRPTLPDNMRPQFGRIRELVEAFGIPIYEKDGFEADDVLGTLSVQAVEQGVNTIIYTGDMDTLQLVNDHVLVKVAKRGISEVTEYNQAEVEARYGFPPQKLIDFKGLVGDKSDNIPGVPGIGEKTASKLLADYGNLEGILAHLDELKPREQKLIRDKAEQAKESKFLATIVRDVPVQLDLDACRIEHMNRDHVLTIFRELEFRTMVGKVIELFRVLGIDAPDDDGVVSEEQSTLARKKSAEPIPQQEEDLLLAPPVGIVPILTPPLPPGAEAESKPFTMAAQVVDGQKSHDNGESVASPNAGEE